MISSFQTVLSRTNTPPGSPAVGDAYWVTASPTGAWTGKANTIAVWALGQWNFLINKGCLIWSVADVKAYVWNNTNLIDPIQASGVLTTKGDLLRFNTVAERMAIGTASQNLSIVSGLPAWVDPPIPVHLTNQTNSAIAANAYSAGIDGSSSLAAKFLVPTGKTFYILCATGYVDTGASAGTYTLSLVLRKNGTNTLVAQTVQTGVSTIYGTSATGTIASPLLSLAAGDSLQVGWDNAVSSPGAMGTNNKVVNVLGVLI